MSDFFSDALKNHKSGKISLAIEQYVKVLQSNTDHPDANHNLGNIYAKSRDARGIKLLENAVRLFPDREIYHVSLIHAHMMFKDFKGAYFCWNKAYELFPISEQIKKLNKKLDIAKSQNSSSKEKIISRIKNFHENQNYDDCITEGDVFLLTEHDEGVCKLVADAKIKTKDYSSAVSILKNALKHSPNDFELNLILSLALNDQHNPSAMVFADRAVKINNESREGLLSLGQALLRNNRIKDAIKNFNKAKELYRDDIRVLHGLAVGLYADNQGAQALEVLDEMFDARLKCSNQGIGASEFELFNVGRKVLLKAREVGTISDTRKIEELADFRLQSGFPLQNTVPFDAYVINEIKSFKKIDFNKTGDARYGAGVCSDGFEFLNSSEKFIRKLKQEIYSHCETVLDGEILHAESFFNIIGAGGGTKPHYHLTPLDISFNQWRNKFSLTYYLDIGDQSSSEPGIIKFYQPDTAVLPSEGMCLIFPSSRKHSAVYNGRQERVMIGMNFYIS